MVDLIVEEGRRIVVTGLVTVADDHSPFCVGVAGDDGDNDEVDNDEDK
jgi:hypothetical protein